MAARQNQLEAVSALLKAGARVDAQDSQGNTPLHEAARNNHVEVLQVYMGVVR
jgi:ankyrin repeat protein